MGDVWLGQPPYYAGGTESIEASGPGGDVLYLPVYVQPDPEAPPRMGASPSRGDGPGLARLVQKMNRHMAEAGPARGWRRSPSAIPGDPPDVQLGCEVDAMGECVLREDERGDPTGDRRLRLAVTRGSDQWRDAALDMLERERASAIVLITVEAGWYWPVQADQRGSKVVELGTDRRQPVPWLTALDRPVQVLQVTGVSFGPDGRARRIGGEGLLARPTPILLSGFGVDALIGEDDLARLLGEEGDGWGWADVLDTLLDGLSGPAGAV